MRIFVALFVVLAAYFNTSGVALGHVSALHKSICLSMCAFKNSHFAKPWADFLGKRERKRKREKERKRA